MTSFNIVPQKHANKHLSHRIILHRPSGIIFGAINFNSQEIEDCEELNKELLTVLNEAHVKIHYASEDYEFYVQDLKQLEKVAEIVSNEFNTSPEIVITKDLWKRLISQSA